MPFSPRTLCTLEEHLKIQNSSPKREMFPHILLSSSCFRPLNPFFHPLPAKWLQKVPAQRAEETGATEPWYVLKIRHHQKAWTLLDLSHESVRSGQGEKSADQLQGEFLLQHRCPAVTHKMLGTDLVLGTYNWDATTATSQERCD